MRQIASLFVALPSLFLFGCGSSSNPSVPPPTLSADTAVAGTANPQVANYTVGVPSAGSVTVRFGTSTSYGRSTSSVSATGAGAVSVLVAGMLANTTYHMQATFTSSAGQVVADQDRTFTTGAVPAKFVATFKATTASGQTPQPGVEMLEGIASPGGLPGPVVTDLSGNVIWTYPNTDNANGQSALSVRMLPNGHMSLLVGQNSSFLLGNAAGVDATSEIREIDLAGTTIRSLSIGALNAELAKNGFAVVGGAFSHELLPLSNGHFLTLVTTLKSVTLTGASAPTTVLGDVVVDLDATWQPVWVWNAFDHLDVNRHPFNFPDWTHGNSIAYDTSDESLIVSLRHQNWVLKINYGGGAGDGAVIWKLGPEGDFALKSGDGAADVDPKDWFYSQHYANPISRASNSVFTMALMDNGDDRQFSDGSSCPVDAGSHCFTTIPLLQIDEGAKTATFLLHQVLTPDLYSFFGGDTEVLSNGHLAYDLAGLANTEAAVYEVTDEAQPQAVWSLQISNGYVYRGNRLTSLYPGVQW